MNSNMEKAEALFKAKKFDEATDICLDLIHNETCKKEAFLLAAKCVLFSTNSPMNREKLNTVINSFGKACYETKTIEEALELEHDMLSASHEWEAKSIKAQLAILEHNPSMEQWKKYYPIFVEYIKIEMVILSVSRDCPVFETYCKEKGIEKEDLSDKLKEEFGNKYKASEVITQNEINTLEFQTAQRIFANTQASLDKNKEGNGEFIKHVADIAINRLGTAELIAKHVLDNNEITPDLHHKCMLLLAEIITYQLSAMIYPNGKAMSLLQTENIRAEYIQRLKEIYAEIQEINSSFEPPSLPDVNPVKIPAPSTAQTSSGGCYVATAVYGSYDCPEVWTLRRFRDDTLSKTWYGRAFIHTYYKISPTLVKWFGHTEWFKNIWKPTLDKMVRKMNNNGVENTPYNDRNW